MGRIRRCAQRISHSYTQYIEKHGMGLVVLACVAVIAGSALWTNAYAPSVPSAPVLPTSEARSAAELLQESLADAVKPTMKPTEAPPQYQPPVADVSVLASFDATRLQHSPVTGMWQLHDAVDIAVQPGEQIMSISDGVVIAVSEDKLHGASITIDHGSGVTACYMGMKALAGAQAGDPVSAGQTIGFGGSGMADESDQPHLHLQVKQNGQSLDPLSLWLDHGK